MTNDEAIAMSAYNYKIDIKQANDCVDDYLIIE